MGRIFSIFKNLILCICIGIILGFFTMVIIWVFSDNKPDADKCLKILRTASAIGAFTVAVIRVLYSVIRTAPVSHATKLSESAAECDKAFEIMDGLIKKTGNINKKNTYRLILSAFYTDNERYDRSLETLAKISFADLPEELQQEYFNAYLYTYLLKGDSDNADKVYNEAEPYFKDPVPSLLHTLGVYEYSKGNYGKAKGFLLQSKAEDDSDRSICSCDMYLALCALKEGKYNDAKALSKEAAYYACTSTDEKNLAKLEHLIELCCTPKQTEQDPEPQEIQTQTPEQENEERQQIND
ncbi:MAG: hypothetical protein IJ696_05115 [Ruminococcus sp.]|nr:hypothetical protein [Ruminococcus sp.]